MRTFVEIFKNQKKQFCKLAQIHDKTPLTTNVVTQAANQRNAIEPKSVASKIGIPLYRLSASG